MALQPVDAGHYRQRCPARSRLATGLDRIPAVGEEDHLLGTERASSTSEAASAGFDDARCSSACSLSAPAGGVEDSEAGAVEAKVEVCGCVDLELKYRWNDPE